MRIAFIIQALAGLVQSAPPTNDDFVELYTELDIFISTAAEGPGRNIPLIIRSVFHDIVPFANDQFGPQGCILIDPLKIHPANRGLQDLNTNLAKIVKGIFPNVDFTFGDILSMAGKVAVEKMYPCLEIDWEFGRPECKPGQQFHEEKNNYPTGHIESLAGFQPFETRWGLTSTELAILVAGGHGIANAQTHSGVSGFGNHVMAKFSSGHQWIRDTLSSTFKRTSINDAGQVEYTNGDIVRMPSDLVHYPTKAEESGANSDADAESIEAELQAIATGERSVFDQAFKAAFSKLLRVGTNGFGLKKFQDTGRTGNGVCDGNLAPTRIRKTETTTTITTTTTKTSSDSKSTTTGAVPSAQTQPSELAATETSKLKTDQNLSEFEPREGAALSPQATLSTITFITLFLIL